MPKIVASVPEAVFYLFRHNPKAGAVEGLCGTGFLVLRPSIRPNGTPHAYGVTNWHVAMSAGASIIRVNTRNGKSRFIEYGPEEWHSPSNGDDLAVIDVSEKLDLVLDDVTGLYEDIFITPEAIKAFSIGIGEDAFMCGLFASHHGGERNVPVARFGNLSMMATDAAPVDLATGKRLACFLMVTCH